MSAEEKGEWARTGIYVTFTVESTDEIDRGLSDRP